MDSLNGSIGDKSVQLPEMVAATSEKWSGAITSGLTRKRRWLRGELPPIARPDVPVDTWGDPMGALEQLRAWAEARASQTIEWYVRDKQSKRWASRALRAMAIVLGVAGAVLPLLAGSLHGLNPNLGYGLLAVAAGCLAFDHFFGLSTGWMRDIATLQALQSGVVRFEVGWTRWQASLAFEGSGLDEDQTFRALELIEDLIGGVNKLAEAETAQWIAEFSNSVAALRKQASPSVTSPQDLIAWAGPAIGAAMDATPGQLSEGAPDG